LTRAVEDVYGNITTTQVGFATVDLPVAVAPAGELEVGTPGRALIDYTDLGATGWSDDTGGTDVKHYFSLVFDDTVVPLTSLTLAPHAHVRLGKPSANAAIRLSSHAHNGVTSESQTPVSVSSMKTLSATTLQGITKNADDLHTKFQDWSGALMELTAGAVQINAGNALDLAGVIGDSTNPAIEFKRKTVAFVSKLFTASPVGLTAPQPLARLLSILGVLSINGPTGPLPAAAAAETLTLARKVWAAYHQTLEAGTRIPDWVAANYIAAVAPVEGNTTDDSRIAFHAIISDLATTLTSQMAYGEVARSVSQIASGVTVVGSKKRQRDHTVVKLPSSSLVVLAWQITDADAPVEMHTAEFKESRPVSSKTATSMVLESPVLHFDAGNTANSVQASFAVNRNNASELRCLLRNAGQLDWAWEASTSDQSSAPAGSVVCNYASLLARRSGRSTGGAAAAWHFAVASVSPATTQTSTRAPARVQPTTVAPASTVTTTPSSSVVPKGTQGNVVVAPTGVKETRAPAEYGAATVASKVANSADDSESDMSTVLLVAVLGSLAILLLFGLTYCKTRGRKKVGIWGETLQRSSKQWNEPQPQTWVAPGQQASKQEAWQPAAPAVSPLPPPLLAPTGSPSKAGFGSDGGSNSGSAPTEHRKSLPGLRGKAFVPAQFAPPTKQGASLDVFNEQGDYDVDADHPGAN